jgi:molybdopterin-containing oxidoreductase family iron-sulfur binding subunit
MIFDNKPIMNNNNTRRYFIRRMAGLTLAGSGMATSSLILGSCSRVEEITGDKIKLLTSSGELVEVDRSALTPAEIPSLSENQRRARTGLTGRQWVMVIDLSRCRNARKCMEACQSHHQLRPEQHHINVLEMKDAEYTAPYYMPKPCMHCDNPPCTKVCPVNATFKREDGIVLIDNERCIGCRFCIAACPYSARVFNWLDPRDAEKYTGVTYNMEANVPQKKGTISKCLFSADRLREGKLPSCVSACPNSVYWFGDRNEDAVTNGTTGETVSFSKLIRDNAGYTLLEELGTKPRVYYLPPRGRAFPYRGKVHQNV